jgi:hypothetical protein
MGRLSHWACDWGDLHYTKMGMVAGCMLGVIAKGAPRPERS